MSPLRQRRRFAIAFWLSVSAFVVFAAMEILSANRQAWFGFDPRYAGHNFSFNFTFYFPLLLLSTGLAGTGFAFWRRGMRELRDEGLEPRLSERLALLPASPVFLLFVMIVVRLVWVMILAQKWRREM